MSKLCEIEAIKHCNKIIIDLHLTGMRTARVCKYTGLYGYFLAPNSYQTVKKKNKKLCLHAVSAHCIVIMPYNENVGCLLMVINVPEWSVPARAVHL